MEGNDQQGTTPPQDSLPDFTDVLSKYKQPTTPATSTTPVADTSGLPDFSAILAKHKAAPDTRSAWEKYRTTIQNDAAQRNEEYASGKAAIFDSLGIKQGRLRGMLSFLPDAANAALNSTPEDVIAGVKGAASAALQVGKEVIQDPIHKAPAVAKGLVEGIGQMVKEPIEVMTNKQINWSTDLTKLGAQPDLTPEEGEKAAKSVGVNVLATLTGMAAENLVGEALVGQKAILGTDGLEKVGTAMKAVQADAGLDAAALQKGASLTNVQLKQLADAAILPARVRETISGLAGGAAGGFAGGFLSGGTPAERIQAGISMAMVTMPLGVAITSTAGMLKFGGSKVADVPLAERISKAAHDVYKMRQLSLSTDQPVAEAMFNINNLEHTQSLAAALALNKLEYETVGVDKNGAPMQYGKNASIIPTNDPMEIYRIVAEHNSVEDRALAITHSRPDGMHDVLIAPNDLPVPEQDFFTKTGFLRGQQVAHAGRDMFVIEHGTPDAMTLRDLVTDQRVEGVNPADISRLSENKSGDVGWYLGRRMTEADVFDPTAGIQGIQAADTENMSMGAVEALKRLRKVDSVVPVERTLTTFTPDVVKTRLTESFLDHIGVSPDGNFMLTPDEAIARAGVVLKGGTDSPTILTRLSDWRLQNIKGEGLPRFFTESKKELSLDETRELLRSQVTSDAVPTVRSTADRAIDRSNMSWRDIVNSYVTYHGIRPEMTQAVAAFAEKTIRASLLGFEENRARLASESTIPVLQTMIDKADATINKLQAAALEAGEMKLADTQAVLEAMDTKEVFTARIKQIKEAGPLPFTEDEKLVYSRLVTEAHNLRMENVGDLSMTAHTNGFKVDQAADGSVQLRDSQTNALLPHVFSDEDAAASFITQAGHPKGIDLDGGSNNLIPPSAIAGHIPPPGPPPRTFESPFEFAPNSTITNIANVMAQVAPWYTTKRAFFVALDNMYKSRFMADVHIPLTTAKIQLEAFKRPFIEDLKTVERSIKSNKILADRQDIITGYRKTRSPQEVVDAHNMGDAEIRQAQSFVDNKIDLSNVFQYINAVEKMKGDYNAKIDRLNGEFQRTNDPLIQQQLTELADRRTQEIADTKEVFGMDDRHMEAVDQVSAARANKDISMLAIARLASSLKERVGGGYEMSRNEYAAAHNMTPLEIQAGEKLDQIHKDVSRANKVDERMTEYFDHFKTYGDLTDIPEQAADMMASGHINVYDSNPIHGALQYINTVSSHVQFNPTWNAARNAAKRHLKLIENGRKAAQDVTDEFINGMRGHVAPSDQLAQGALDKFMQDMGSDLKPEIRADGINTFLAASSGAMMGGRVAQGVRDFVGSMKIYASRFGMARYANGFKLAFQRNADGVRMIDALAQEGKVPGLSPLAFASENELAEGLVGTTGRVKQAIFSASQVGLDLSAQHNAYGLIHAIAYLDTKELASKVLLDISRGKLTREQGYKKLFMNSYDLPAAQSFDALVMAGKHGEAAEQLAQSTGAETAFIMGLQQHPYGWGSNFGKLAGQMGQWRMWERNYLVRLAGRGTGGERAAAMARFASAEVATAIAGRTLGYNMRSWYSLPSMIFMGGPAYSMLQQIQDLNGVNGQTRQDMATSQLKQGRIPIVSQVIPGASAFSDYFQAYQLSQNRYGPVAVIGKGLGFSVDKTQKSFIDELQGNNPKIGGQPQSAVDQITGLPIMRAGQAIQKQLR